MRYNASHHKKKDEADSARIAQPEQEGKKTFLACTKCTTASIVLVENAPIPDSTCSCNTRYKTVKPVTRHPHSMQHPLHSPSTIIHTVAGHVDSSSLALFFNSCLRVGL